LSRFHGRGRYVGRSRPWSSRRRGRNRGGRERGSLGSPLLRPRPGWTHPPLGVSLSLMRVLLFLVVAAALAAYAFWIYLRVELAVPAARRLAVVRACVLALLLLLLFDPRIPSGGGRGSATRWVLLDASSSMSATDAEGRSAWEGAAARARELDAEGWKVVRFAGAGLEAGAGMLDEPTGLGSRLGPARIFDSRTRWRFEPCSRRCHSASTSSGSAGP
jgi:hypothetical protein